MFKLISHFLHYLGAAVYCLLAKCFT